MPYSPWLLTQKIVDCSESSQFRNDSTFVLGRGQRKCYLSVEPLDDDLAGSDYGTESLSVSSMSSYSTRTTVHNQIESFALVSPANTDFIAKRFITSHETQATQTHDFTEAESSFHQVPYGQKHNTIQVRVHQCHDFESPAQDYFYDGAMRLNSDSLSSPSGSVNGAPRSRRSLLPEPDLTPGPSNASASYIGAEHSWHDAMVLAVELLEGIKMVDRGELPRRRRDRSTGQGVPAPHR